MSITKLDLPGAGDIPSTLTRSATGCLLLALVMVLLPMAGSAETVRLAGSDFFAANTAAALHAEAEKRGMDLVIDLSGSVPALDSLAAGKADAALIIEVAGTGSQTPDAYEAITVGHFAVGVIVHADNPLESISLDQLATIFSSGVTLVRRRWGEFGLGGAWVNRAIEPFVATGETHFALDLLKNRALGGAGLAGVVAVGKAQGAVVEQTSKDRGVIGVIALTDLPAGVRLLGISDEEGASAVLPTPETLAVGSYPLGVAVKVVFASENAVMARTIADLLATTDVAAGMRSDLFLPLSTGE